MPENIDIKCTPSGVSFQVHVSAGAKRTLVGGVHDASLRVAVTTAPEKGKANDAVLTALAKALKVRRSQCQLVSGQISRRKTIHIDNLTEEQLSQRLNDLQ